MLFCRLIPNLLENQPAVLPYRKSFTNRSCFQQFRPWFFLKQNPPSLTILVTTQTFCFYIKLCFSPQIQQLRPGNFEIFVSKPLETCFIHIFAVSNPILKNLYLHVRLDEHRSSMLFHSSIFIFWCIFSYFVILFSCMYLCDAFIRCAVRGIRRSSLWSD